MADEYPAGIEQCRPQHGLPGGRVLRSDGKQACEVEFIARRRRGASEPDETHFPGDKSGGKGPPRGLAGYDIQRRADRPNRDSTSPDRRKHTPCDLPPDPPACGPPFPPARCVADQPRRNLGRNLSATLSRNCSVVLPEQFSHWMVNCASGQHAMSVTTQLR